jgi:hypothetical protein
VQKVWDVGGPALPPPPIHKGVPDGGRVGEAAEGSGYICTSPLAADSVHGDVLEQVEVFKYLG